MTLHKYYRFLTAILLSLQLLPAWAQKFPGLADTPPMGWNSWNKFGCDISEKLIRETADAMVKSGLRDAGYVYINIDDCWHGERDANGFIQADPVRFPSGIKALADYIHSRGLKIGIFSDAGDITHCWECEEGHGSWSSLGVLNVLDKQAGLRKYARPGQWNDPDMLEVGLLSTLGENRAHFSMWAMLAAPLIFGADIPTMPAEVRNILANRDVIAVDQDKLGIQGFAFIKTRGVEYWAKPLANGEWAIAILNRTDEPKKISHDWRKHDIGDDVSGRNADFSRTVYDIRDLWAGRAAGTTETPLNVTIPGRDIVMLRLSPKK